MCVAVPGKVVSVEGTKGQVDFNGNQMLVKLNLVDAKVGDYVLVHAGCAMEVMDKEKAEELISLFDELEEVMRDGR